MTLEEYQKQAHPGRKVFIMHRGQKVYGIAGNLYGSGGIEYVVKFDFGMVKVTETNAYLFNLEDLD